MLVLCSTVDKHSRVKITSRIVFFYVQFSLAPEGGDKTISLMGKTNMHINI